MPVDEEETLSGTKRAHDEIESSTVAPVRNVPSLRSSKSSSKEAKSAARWRPHGLTEDYVNVVGEIMQPPAMYGPFGFDPMNGRFPIERITMLGYLTSPLRRPLVIEKWSPLEISLFEAAISLYGKNFNRIQKYLDSKTVQEVIEFYYVWKKTSHYKEWKRTYTPDERDHKSNYEFGDEI